MNYTKPNSFVYGLTKVASFLLATFVFGRRILRNEIKDKKGPYIVIANHECMLDFVNLIGLTKEKLTFVTSSSFFNSLPIKGMIKKLAVIPKQQFQTKASDLKKMKSVISSGHALCVYPAGLMTEDGLSTPIPDGTYKFLKWLGVDVYVARISGSYFVMPKWAKGLRHNRTYIDVYKLFDKDEIINLELNVIKEKVDEALLFDAYKEQEYESINNQKISGLENVLYLCPNCKKEFEVVSKNNVLSCSCGYAEYIDKKARLHKIGNIGEEISLVSDWSRWINEKIQDDIRHRRLKKLVSNTDIYLLDYDKKKYVKRGFGVLTLTKEGFNLSGKIDEKDVSIDIPIACIPTLPIIPGKHIELQKGDMIYRCVLENGKLCMKYIHMVESFYILNKNRE